MSRDARFKFITDAQGAEAETYAHGLGYPSVGALARVLVLRTMKQYPLRGRKNTPPVKSHGTDGESPAGVLPGAHSGQEGEGSGA